MKKHFLPIFVHITLTTAGISQCCDSDADGDGYCDDVDCDDQDNDVHPGAEELCDDVDNDCDGTVDEEEKTYYRDNDSDGYGVSTSTTTACSTPTGYASRCCDCNDNDANVNPGEYEICNEIDDDCNGDVDEDDTCQCTYAVLWDYVTITDGGDYGEISGEMTANDETYYWPEDGDFVDGADEGDVWQVDEQMGNLITVTEGTDVELTLFFEGTEWDTWYNDKDSDTETATFSCAGNSSKSVNLYAYIEGNCDIKANVDITWTSE